MLLELPSRKFSCRRIFDVSIDFSPLSTLRWLWSPTTTPSKLLMVLFPKFQTQWAAVSTNLLLTSVPPHSPLSICFLSGISLTIHGFELGLTSHALGPPILPIDPFEFILMQPSPSLNRAILSLSDYMLMIYENIYWYFWYSKNISVPSMALCGL